MEGIIRSRARVQPTLATLTLAEVINLMCSSRSSIIAHLAVEAPSICPKKLLLPLLIQMLGKSKYPSNSMYTDFDLFKVIISLYN